jgi:hypothetical protein
MENNDIKNKFFTDWNGPLPIAETREELRGGLIHNFKLAGFSDGQIEESLDFFEEYEKRYYEPTEGEYIGRTYHRFCGGGSVIEKGADVHCAKCGIIPGLPTPDHLRKKEIAIINDL